MFEELGSIGNMHRTPNLGTSSKKAIGGPNS